MEGSPGCWATFGDLIAVDYSSFERMQFHQIIVDAYAAQHPNPEDPRGVQSVGLHLMTLCLFLEHDADPSLGTALHQRMIRRPQFHALSRTGPGRVTVDHVPTTGASRVARAAAYEWARSVWETYDAEHDTVHQWLRESGFDL